MEEPKREKQLSVTNFIHCGDEYLFLERDMSKAVDPGLLNGVGGKVDPGEDFVTAVIRETKEETGYDINAGDIRFLGVIDFPKGYSKEWITAFFETKVSHKNIPIGTEIKEGKLCWIHKDEVLTSGFKLVDDINYIWKDVLAGTHHFFMSAEVGESDFKIIKESTKKIKR